MIITAFMPFHFCAQTPIFSVSPSSLRLSQIISDTHTHTHTHTHGEQGNCNQASQLAKKRKEL